MSFRLADSKRADTGRVVFLSLQKKTLNIEIKSHNHTHPSGIRFEMINKKKRTIQKESLNERASLRESIPRGF